MAALERADAAIAAGEAPLIDAAPGTGAMLAEFRHTRAATVAQLEALPLRAWGRKSQHTEFGRVTILQQVGYFASHDAFHLPDFVQKRRQLAQPEGQWQLGFLAQML